MNWEVRTMRSAISSSDRARRPHAWFSPTLFWKNFTRFWPIWALYGAFWFLSLTVGILNSRTSSPADPGYFPTGYVVNTIELGLPVSFIFGVLAAMAVFSYLYFSRSAGLMHALPLRREGLFLTSYLSGLSFFLLPILAVALLTLLAELYAGHGVDLTSLFLWSWCQALMSLFFYSFAVFCAMFTGHLLALPIFYGILNGLAAGLWWLFQMLADLFLFGYSQLSVPGPWVEWLSPFLCYMDRLSVTDAPDYRLTGLLPIFVYGLAGLVLAGLALLLYRRRAVECAGDVISVSWVRPIFKYGVAFCSAVTLGPFLWSLFFPGFVQQKMWALLFFLLLCGALGYFVAEMLMHKTFRVFRLCWKGVLPLLAALVLAVGALEFDLTGYEDRVPDAGQVAEVRISGSGTAPYDDAAYNPVLSAPEDIARLVELHSAITAHQAELEQDPFEHRYTSKSLDGYTVDVEECSVYGFDILYLLRDGGTLCREYSIPISQDLLDDPDSLASKLNAIINAPGYAERQYFRHYQPGDTLTSADLSVYSGASRSFGSQDSQRLLAAVQEDLSTGRLGIRYLLEDEERHTNCYYNDLSFTFYTDRTGNGDPEGHYYSVTITLQTTASSTLQVLEELGCTDELRTWAELSQ